MTVVGARIDNRLLHGIVATNWAPQSGATRVMVVDDDVALDAMQKETMKLGRPAGMAVSIITQEVAVTNFKSGKYDSQKVFIVSKTPDIFLKLIQAGVQLSAVNLGGTLTFEDAIKVTNRAYIKPDQVETYSKIIQAGVPVTSRYVPADHAVDVASIISEQ